MYFYLGDCNYSKEEISVMLSVQTLIRVTIYFLLTLALIIRSAFGLFAYDTKIAIALAAGSLLLNTSFFYLARQRIFQTHHAQFIRVLPVVDIVLISLMVFLSGGIESRFSFLYVLPCLSLVPFSFRDVMKISAVAIVAYILVVAIDYYGIIQIMEHFSYSVGQLAFIGVIRLVFIILLTVISVLLLLTQLLRTIHSNIERKNEAVFNIINELGGSLEEVHDFLYKFKAGTEPSHKLYKESEMLQAKITDALSIKDQLLAKAEQAVPMSRMTAWGSGLTCQVCNKKIKLFGHYWAIPSGYRFSHNYGNYQNELHCDSCHQTYGGPCLYCQVWNKA